MNMATEKRPVSSVIALFTIAELVTSDVAILQMAHRMTTLFTL
jgi:hypothetical protein